MEPATIGLVSAGVGAAGSLISGVAQNSQAGRQASVSDANAKIAEDQAAADAASIRDKAARVKGSEEAAIGASGIAPSGFADAENDSDIEAKLDEQTALYNGRIAARNQRAQASAMRDAGKSALIGGVIGAGTRALSGYGAWKYLSATAPGGGMNPAVASAPGMSRFQGVF